MSSAVEPRTGLQWSPVLRIGAGLVALFVLMALFAPWIAPYEPRAPAGPALAPPSSAHWFGTTDIGQDVLSQIVWGARTSLVVVAGAAGLTLVLAVLVGVGAALIGGAVDLIAMRVVDVFLAVPTFPVAILVAALTGASRVTLVLVLGLLMWPAIARLVRSQALSVRQRGFVGAARGYGGGLGYVVRRHLVPAVAPVLVSGLVAVAGNAVLLEASLAFLGLADPISTSWGLMMNQALATQGLYFTDAWLWWVLPTGFAIALTVLGFTFVGVGLEPVLNPRWQRTA